MLRTSPPCSAMVSAQLLDMALVPSYGHNDAVPNSHRLYVGPPGGRGAGEAGQALNQADVIIALGSRLSQGTTAWNYGVINPETQIIQIDIEPRHRSRRSAPQLIIISAPTLMGLERCSTRFRRQRAESRRGNAALGGSLIRRGNPQKYIFVARIGSKH